MKLLAYVLLLLNIGIAFGQWLEYRKVRVLPEFEMPEGIAGIRLLVADDVAVIQQECWLLGPVSSEDRANKLRADMASIDYFAELVSSEIQKAPSYWVYYGPMENYGESLGQLREFKAKGIDSFIIGDGSLKGSISLGVFANIDSARRMTSIMDRRGYSVKMAEIPKYEKEYWVSVKVAIKEGLKDNFDRFLEQEKMHLDARKVFCK